MTTPRSLRLTAHYPEASEDLLRPLIELMSVGREVCGDLETFLVILAVAVRTAAHPDFKTLSQERLSACETPTLPSLGTNIRSIAASVGIPKETVRRKVGELEAAGWFLRRAREVIVTSDAYVALAPVRAAIERLALRHADVVNALLGDLGNR